MSSSVTWLLCALGSCLSEGLVVPWKEPTYHSTLSEHARKDGCWAKYGIYLLSVNQLAHVYQCLRLSRICNMKGRL